MKTRPPDRPSVTPKGRVCGQSVPGSAGERVTRPFATDRYLPCCVAQYHVLGHVVELRRIRLLRWALAIPRDVPLQCLPAGHRLLISDVTAERRPGPVHR